MYEYRAEVIRVIDGDTMILEVDLGFRIKVTYRFRIKNLDTPEIYGVRKGSPEYIRGKAASDYAKELLPVGKEVTIKSNNDPGIYGRFSAHVYFTDKEGNRVTYSQVMEDAGHQKGNK